MKLNLACGNDHMEGFVNVDRGAVCNPDKVANLLTLHGWTWLEDNSADEMMIRHFVEHIPHVLPGIPKDGLIWFMEQVYRVAKDGAVIHMAFPHPQSLIAYGDPTHCRQLSHVTIQYFDSLWRSQHRFGQYDIQTDIEIKEIANTLLLPHAPTDPTLSSDITDKWNVVWETILACVVHKPMRI